MVCQEVFGSALDCQRATGRVVGYQEASERVLELQERWAHLGEVQRRQRELQVQTEEAILAPPLHQAWGRGRTPKHGWVKKRIADEALQAL